MKTLSIDIETFSDVDLGNCGLYKYVESDNFEILLFAYSYDFGSVDVIDLTKEELPESIVHDLNDPTILKTAYNAAFEYNCLSKFYETDISQWQCTMVHACYCGYPLGLANVAIAMGLPEDKQKDKIGKTLIKLFCEPRTPTKRNPATRVYPQNEPEKWKLFIEYNRQDVVVETEIKKRLLDYPLPDFEQSYWVDDMKINSCGVRVDEELVQGAMHIAEMTQNRLVSRMKSITGLNNPNSVIQIKNWLNGRHSDEITTLRKDDIPKLIEKYESEGDTEAAELLQLRQQAGKTSIAKYEKMNDAICKDGRIRGLLQFYGTKTGRWAGRLVQVQNLPRNYLSTLNEARYLVKTQDEEFLSMLYGDVQDTISQLIRTAFIPSEGKIFAVADYSAIEARVIAWLSGESWRMDVFNSHGKIYEASASQMFHVPVESIAKGRENYALRAKGKIAELALGYQGSVGALKKMGALDMGLSEDELPDIVRAWRSSNPAIVGLWDETNNAAISAVETPGKSFFCAHNRVKFLYDKRYLTITLPSGRELFYLSPLVVPGDFNGKQVVFTGMNQTTKKLEQIRMYGGKWTENIIQAIARDCLAEAIHRLCTAGYLPKFHVHDEVIVEVDRENDLNAIIEIMCKRPEWAKDLPLNAAGFTSSYYMKD